MKSISSIVPDPQKLLALETPEVAFVLLQHLASGNVGSSPERSVFMGNFFQQAVSPVNAYPAEYQTAITEHLIMAWQWLLRENLLIPYPGNTTGWVCVSSRGHKAVAKEQFDKYRHAALLPQGILHPSMSATAFSAFLRGEYDIAIFAAFRALENMVRDVCKYSSQAVGVKLMRDAFDPKSGPLTDKTLVNAEQEAMAHVYAGAIGLFKNPTSHRLNSFTRPEEAVSLVLLANYLIAQVEDLARANGLI
ncbi:MAG TPA: TIGR02391 family protein [Terracidiphilus sp.]|jgi:uncharacterized protein (TIGR02391 family)